ncbi:hypothetical protein EH228_04175 [Erwinia endophytica]|uniref:hypothetical protein n=1 Tax=Erwinia endophytica TaxID=1563158 RepID=UPI001265ECF0|nr:hypothetical protein [Erwinia endophytica]KAB8313332.1 hypothetical protein EH228_04175 [Erwinia endophytica]
MISKTTISVLMPFRGQAFSLHVIVLLSAMICSAASGATGPETLNMTANMIQTSCDITFVQGEQANGTVVNSIPLPDTDPSGLTSNGGSGGDCKGSECIDTTHSTAVTLKLSGCFIGKDDVKPTVTLTGFNALSADVPSTTDLGYLFRDAGDAGGTSREYAILVGKKKAMTWSAADLYNSSGGLPGGTAANSVIALTGGAGVNNGNSGNGASATVWLAVSCAFGCQSTSVRSGSLNASLTFNSTYK